MKVVVDAKLKKAGLLFCQKPVELDETAIIQFNREDGGVLEYFTDSSSKYLWQTNNESLIDQMLPKRILICSEYSVNKLVDLSQWFLGEDQGIFSSWENSFVFSMDSVYTLSTQHMTESSYTDSGQKNLQFSLPLRIFKILKLLEIKNFQVTIQEDTVFLYGDNGQLKLTYKNEFNKLIELTESAKKSLLDLKERSIETNISFNNYLKKDIDKIKSVSDSKIVDLNSFLKLPIVADIRYLRILAGGKNKNLKLNSLSYKTKEYIYNYYCGSYHHNTSFFFCGARVPIFCGARVPK